MLRGHSDHELNVGLIHFGMTTGISGLLSYILAVRDVMNSKYGPAAKKFAIGTVGLFASAYSAVSIADSLFDTAPKPGR